VTNGISNGALRKVTGLSDHIKVELVGKKKETSDLLADGLARVTVALIEAALVMFGLQAAHSLWVSVPAAGYWTCFLLVLGLSGVASALHAPGRKLST
jgi:hypothetical protein